MLGRVLELTTAEHAGPVGHERGDDVDELRETRDTDPVCVPEQRVHEAAHELRAATRIHPRARRP